MMTVSPRGQTQEEKETTIQSRTCGEWEVLENVRTNLDLLIMVLVEETESAFQAMTTINDKNDEEDGDKARWGGESVA